MPKHAAIFIAALLLTNPVASADAKPRHGHHQSQSRMGGHPVDCTERGCSDRASQTRETTDANGGAVSRRPAGCPHAFCGCEASLYLFGQIRADLNLASNWLRKFPRTSPAAGMAAVRNHHVMVLVSQVDGNNWLVHDGNSGGGLTREHVRSIAGYAIVNPRGA
jgi:hypothetical protein